MKVRELFEMADKSKEDEFIEILRKNCPKNLHALVNGRAVPLLRGMTVDDRISLGPGDPQYAVIKGHSYPRNSKTGTNLCLNFVDSSPLWKEFPKRSFSAMCTTNDSHAAQFGSSRWLVIPFDNVRGFGVTPADFNEGKVNGGAFSVVFFDLCRICSSCRYVASRYDARSSVVKENPEIFKILSNEAISKVTLRQTLSQEDFKLLSANTLKLHEFFEEHKDSSNELIAILRDGGVRKHVEELFEGMNAPSLWEFLNTKVSPEGMNAKIYNSYPEIKIPTSDVPEVWFEGDYICIWTGDLSELPESKWLKEIEQKVNL